MAETIGVLSFINVGGLMTALVVLSVTWTIGHLLPGFFNRLGNRFTHRRLVLQQVGTFVRFVVYVTGATVALVLSLNLSRELVLALSGSVAVTVGFALKDLAASVIAGLIVLVDRPFQVGDRVTFGGYYGTITSIGLRSVRLVTLDDTLITIPNNKFLTDLSASANAGALDMLVQMDFYVGIDQDVARAKQIVADAVTATRYAFLQKPWTVLVNQVTLESYFAVRLRAKVYVLDVVYEKALETDVTERVLEGFGRAGLQPPAVLHRSLPPLDPGATV
ncbi:MAG: mechanosensitive ion channel [Deltaproteobacteria bacterium]|nr:mechanosensitive ion channel [Deltaproteobacteria bacterium]